MSRAANLESIDKNLSRPSSSSTSGMNDDSEPMKIGELYWRQRSSYRQPPRQNWYPPHILRRGPGRGPAGPQGYSGGRFVPTRRPWNNYSNLPPVFGSGPPGYGSGPSGSPPPHSDSGGRFVPSRRFGDPAFTHNTST